MITTRRFVNREAELTRLRATVASIEHELAQLPLEMRGHNGSPSTKALVDAFAELVAQLDLGFEPETRQCPVCQQVVRRTATLCGHCWTALDPITAHGPAGTTTKPAADPPARVV
jgi:Double zinc ribbon domain